VGDAPIRTEQLRKLYGSLVAVSEALRASLTPQLPHMPVWGFMLALAGGSIGLAILSLRTFQARVVT
jgi:ABC-2 type transport system permease protein